MKEATKFRILLLLPLCLTSLNAMDTPEGDHDEEQFYDCSEEFTDEIEIMINPEKHYILHDFQIKEFLKRNGLDLTYRYSKISILTDKHEVTRALESLRKDIKKTFNFAQRNISDYFIQPEDDFEALVSKFRLMELSHEKYKEHQNSIQKNELRFFMVLMNSALREEPVHGSRQYEREYARLLNDLEALIQKFFLNTDLKSEPMIHILIIRSSDRKRIKLFAKPHDESEYLQLPVHQDHMGKIRDLQTRLGCRALFCLVIFMTIIKILLYPGLDPYITSPEFM